ncbi:hypothetical protein K466DRAFT_556600 [Polyporus arcularius HHB13444]|uniref:F-box domain-containing protein n=1 Tax=Polyporus arcularius HHB13444 TaxID=1314778 RepID=A0A5C3P9F6_9APHY|nr:hypothetical protein K466DRAFT_556600 [Polyporus arcularius HHB13444]
MNLLSLNDDVLRAIFAALHGPDALNVSLTSKRAYALAAPRIASQMKCREPEELPRLHTYLLADLPNGVPRGRFLESLFIDTGTFAEDIPEDADADHLFGTDFSQAHLLGDILLEARNLRDLFFERFQPCLERDPRIGDAIRSLTSLVKLRLYTIADSSLSVFDSFRSDRLASLTLSYHVSTDYPLRNHTKTLPPLVSALSSLHHLRTVELIYFHPPTGLTHATSRTSPAPSFPSIQCLRMSDTSLPALYLVEYCPNLSTLEAFPDPTIGELDGEGPKWPPLHRLMVWDLDGALSFSKRLRTADQFQIPGPVRLSDSDVPIEASPEQHLLDLLRTTSPIGLYMRITTSCQEKMFWGSRLLLAAPRLRSLEINLEGKMPEETEDYSWLSALPTALMSLPLICLRVFVEGRQYDVSIPELDQGLGPRIRHREINRVKALLPLPPLLVRAIPSLRYLSIGDMAPNSEVLGRTAVDPSIRALCVDEKDVEWEWDALRRLAMIRRQCWWRVVDGTHERELVEISVEEGEEAQRRIESVTEDTTATMGSASSQQLLHSAFTHSLY